MDNVGTGAWVGIVTISVLLSHTAVKIKSELPQESLSLFPLSIFTYQSLFLNRRLQSSNLAVAD
jgi:hypothetical protein